MGFLRFLGRRSRRRLFVLGLDGVPHSLLARQIAAGNMPFVAELVRGGSLVRADSVHPCVSCVAWASYQTGCNPGKHGIFGFQDRKPGTYETYIATGRHLQGQTLWEILSSRGKRVISLNVPGTYPPRPINGLMVGDFLSPQLEGATYPPELAGRLAAMGYRIDADVRKGHENTDAFVDDLHEVLQARCRSAKALMTQEDWDLFQLHIMETDRINHFLFLPQGCENPNYASAFDGFYAAVDTVMADLVNALDDRTSFLCLSDHGFCHIKREVQLNAWLRSQGYLEPLAGEAPKLSQLTEATRAFSLDPGRVYLNLKGREPRGSVEPGAEQAALIQELTQGLLALTDPESGEPVVREVLHGEQLFAGPLAARGPDLLAVPHDGYDLKGGLGSSELFTRGARQGMHTFSDAFWLLREGALAGHPTIMDGAPTALALLGESPIPEMDGTPRID